MVRGWNRWWGVASLQFLCVIFLMGLLKSIGLLVLFGFAAQIVGATLSVVAEETAPSPIPPAMEVSSANPEAMVLWTGVGFVVVLVFYGGYRVIR